MTLLTRTERNTVMEKKKNVAPQGTRKVVVERTRVACVRCTAEVVLCVPADMTNSEIQDIAWEHSHRLPDPDAWKDGYRLEAKHAEELRPTVIRDAQTHEASVATFAVDEQGFVTLVADENGSGGSTDG